MNENQVSLSLDGWRSRGYLPHFDGGKMAQNVTYRLADSLPAQKLAEWSEELKVLSEYKRDRKRRKLIEAYLDKGPGEVLLAKREIAEIVQNTLLFFNRKRYDLHSWVVVPNHVHVLFTPTEGVSISSILHSWKSFSANKANKILGRTGAFWQDEYFDRFVRSERHYLSAIEYIENNPVKAGLCSSPNEWYYSSANFKV